MPLLRHGDVPRPDWQFPSRYIPLLPYTVRLHLERASHRPGVWRNADVVPRFIAARILLNIPHDVIQTLT